jgi:hypothetical protein
MKVVAVDDISIYEKSSIYSGTSDPTISPQIVSGTSWVDFYSGTNIVCALNAHGQNLGSTTVHAYINSSGIRNQYNQYYHR